MTGERLGRTIGVAFRLSVAAVVLVLVLSPGLTAREEIPLESALARRHVSGNAFFAELPRSLALMFSDDVTLTEDGLPLPFPDAARAEIAAVGSGRYAVIAKRTVFFSAKDNTDPLANGRRYALSVRPDAVYSLPALGLSLLAGVLAILAWRTGGLCLTGVSPLRVRALVALVTLAALGAGLSRSWDRLSVAPDSLSYVRHSAVRPALYPAFLDAFDRGAGTIETDDETLRTRKDPENRLIDVVRAQKVLTVLAIATLVFVLTGGVNAWLVAALTWLVVAWDLARSGGASIDYNVNCVLSEGLNHALVFFFLASVFSYAKKPGVPRGLLLSGVLALLVLTRPVNAAFASVFLLVFLVSQDGRKKAALRVLVLGLALAAPLALACGVNARKTGHWKLHAFTGWITMNVAVLVATPDDVAAFEDPRERELVRIIVVEDAAIRRTDYDPDTIGDVFNTNLYRVALPAFDRVYETPPGETPDYYKDAVFSKVASRILARNKAAYARYVLFNVRQVVSPLHLILLPCLVWALVLWRRTRAYQHLFLAFFATIPLVLLLATCVFQPPMDRYRAPLGFAETFAPPLFLGILATLRKSQRI